MSTDRIHTNESGSRRGRKEGLLEESGRAHASWRVTGATCRVMGSLIEATVGVEPVEAPIQ